MRALLALVILGLAAGPILTVTNVRAQPPFSAGLDIHSVADFHAPLSAYGNWVDVAPYGDCWQPTAVPTGWRPYSNGSWEWTDLGWYWVSDEPWAWACYHYGTWVYDPAYGWLWVPGTEWAPAWVAWRETPDFIGWAPCTLGGLVPAPSLFVFVDIHRFHQRIRPDLLVVNNTTILRQSRVINNLRRETRQFGGAARTVVINLGPGVQSIQQAAGTRFTARPVGEVVARTPAPATIRRSPPAGGTERPLAPTGREQRRTPPATPPPVPPASPAPR